MVLTCTAVEFQCCKWKKGSWIREIIQKDERYSAKI